MLNVTPFTPLELPELVSQAKGLPSKGRLANSINNLCYLDISDAFIHQLFPLLQTTPAKKPHYFGKNLIGAHISVVYPEENRLVPEKDLGQEHHFSIKGAFTAELGLKRYYVLSVEAPTLLVIRKKLGLPDLLAFKNQWVALHITVGVCPLSAASL